MALFDDSIRKQLTDVLANMKYDTTLVYVGQEIECQTCQSARQFLEEISSLNAKLKLQKYNLQLDKARVAELGIDKVPAIALLDRNGQDTRIRFYGIPGGYEINSFLSSILEVATDREPLPPEWAARVARISKPVHIQVFVTLTCPHCPDAVITAHRLALENANIRADMIEANTFTPMAIQYNVSGVPKIVINEKHELLGSRPLGDFLEIIEKL